MLIMKTTKTTASILALATLLTTPFSGRSQNTQQKAKPYPLDTCVVSGEKLGEMGDAYVFTCEGQEVKMCCKNCFKDFNKDPDKYIKKINEAAAATDNADKKGKD